jgi:hypothetical protein
MSELLGILTAFGVSAPAGLNAYLPLLIVGLTARFTNLITLNEPYRWLTNEWVLLVIAFLLFIEFFADKVPGIDHVNDVVSTVIRPAAGAILFAASSNVFGDIHPVVAIILGLLSAGSVHAVKATARPAVTTFTMGLGNPVVSAVEDVLAAVTTIVAIIAPVFVLVFILALAIVAFSVLRSRPQARPLL